MKGFHLTIAIICMIGTLYSFLGIFIVEGLSKLIAGMLFCLFITGTCLGFYRFNLCFEKKEGEESISPKEPSIDASASSAPLNGDERTCETCGVPDEKILKGKDAKPEINCPPMHEDGRYTTIEYDPEDALDRADSGEPMPKTTAYQEWQQPFIDDTYREIFSKIPLEILNLLWFKNGPLSNCPDKNEPSAIDVHLPIQISPIDSKNLEDIGYYPSYSKLSPKQRYIYLNWLCDMTQPIAIGYVFIFYYGLERYLLTEKYESALKMIMNLRLKYDNQSFLAYSADAILIGCALHHRPDLLQLDESKLHNTALLFIRTYVFKSLSAQSIMDTCTLWGFTNKRYITGHPARFLTSLQTHIYDLYQQDTVPISQTDYEKAQKTNQIVLANISLENRFATSADISTSPALRKVVYDLLVKSHESVKSDLRMEATKKKPRQDSNGTKSDEIQPSCQTENKGSHTYFTADHTIQRTDHKPITEEDIPHRIHAGLEAASAQEQNNPNPKFHRSEREEELSFQFWYKHGEKISELENKIYGSEAPSSTDVDEQIAQLKDQIEAFYKLRKYCYRTKGGTIYFQDTWEYCRNSKNHIFSYVDDLENELEYLTKYYNVLKNLEAMIIDCIKTHPNLLQKNIYALIEPDLKSTIQSKIRELEKAGKIKRTKKSNSYILEVI